MMKQLLFFCLASQILATSLFANKVLFIQGFQNNTNDSKYDYVGQSLADMVITDIVALKINGVEVVERERIESLLSELKLQESEYFDQATTQKMGEGLGANYALAGSFTVMNGVMRIDARLIDVASSKIHLSFKTKGDEEAIYDLEEELVRNIGKGLKVDVGNISRDKLSSPKQLDTLVKYADADRLMNQGDYKAATKVLGEVRKKEPEFRLGDEAYKEAMRKLYAAKEKRKDMMSDAESQLFESALQKSKTTNHKVGFAYQWVLMEIYFRQMRKNAGLPYKGSIRPTAFMSRGDRQRAFEMMKSQTQSRSDFISRKPFEKKLIKDMEKYQADLERYVQAYQALLGHSLNLRDMDLMLFFSRGNGMEEIDRQHVVKLGWSYRSPSSHSELFVDLATFLLRRFEVSSAPFEIDEQYKDLGFRLLADAPERAWVMEDFGDLLAEHGRTEDAIAKWQEILDKYPALDGYRRIEGKIINVLK